MDTTEELITDEWLDANFDSDKGSYSSYPNSSDPDKKCYEWFFMEHLVIDYRTDYGYAINIKYFTEYGSEIKEIKKLKYRSEVEQIAKALS